ncbi:MAG TPA: hypothetical protein VIS55_07020 [Pseudomonadales bacterium]|jgi:hypothetical protein
MKNRIPFALMAALGFFAMNACADTEEVSSTAYWTIVAPAEEYKMTNGATMTGGGIAHANVINNEGEHLSQWCRGITAADAEGKGLGGAGFCTIIDQAGDAMWVWFSNNADGQGGTWGVIGGTGAYAGASGGGTSGAPTSMSPDGRSWINTSTGTITTP